MDVLLPHSLDEALAIKAEHPEAVPLSGGTDLMVELNFGRLRPAAIIDLNRVPELTAWREENGRVFLGSGVTYTTIVREMQAYKPLVQASRSVGSPQIRNRGTVGGNLGTASPAGDALPVLAAYDAEVILRSRARGERSLPWNRFLTGPKKTAIAPDELILGTRWRRFRGPGSFSKIGTRNAMEIANVVVRTRVNGVWREADVWPGTSLLVFLREALGLYGSKNACEQGECGSCSVWLDGTLACSCLVLAAQAHDREVRTVESLTSGDRLHPIQEAFLEAGAVQCGFCTPGFVVAVADLLEKDANPSPATVREALSGNLCRCTGYQKILDAVHLAATRRRAGS